jgi:hypothetical protein
MIESEADQQNLADLKDVAQAVEHALAALKSAMVGGPPGNREAFIFQVGYARGRLSRISSRIYQAGEFGEEPVP